MSAVRFTDITPDAVLVSIDVVEVLRTIGDEQLRAECERRAPATPQGAAELTGAHVRAARALLDWPLARLAAESGVSVSTIKRLEDGGPERPRPGKVEALRSALERGGAGFRAIDGTLCVGPAGAHP